jgi:hypothetical protein
MKRIKLVLAVGVVMAALLALNVGTALADDRVEFDDRINGHKIEDIEVESDGELDVEFVGGGGFETDEIDVFGFDLVDIDEEDEDEVILVDGHLLNLDSD